MNCLDSKMKLQCYAIFLTLACIITSTLADSSPDSSPEKGTGNLFMPIGTQRVERSPKYDFGLGKRRYIITTGLPGKKRLPHYNFGLGKRAETNEVSNYDDDTEFFSPSNNLIKAGITMENWDNVEDTKNDIDSKNEIDVLNDYELYGYPQYPREIKRSPRPEKYNFGLGKRRVYDFGLGKRKYNDEYDKRLPNYPRFNFGLGKKR